MDNSTLKSFAVLVVGGACVVPSALINGAYQLSKPGPLMYPLTAASVFFAVFAAISLVSVHKALRQSDIFGFVAALFLFVICSVINIANAVNIASNDRATTVGGREVANENATRWQTRLEKSEKEKSGLSAKVGSRTTGMIDADIRALEQNILWDQTKKCTDATLAASRSYCSDHERLIGDLAAAGKIASLESEISELNTKLDSTKAASNQAADPQAHSLTFALGLLGITVEDGRVGVVLNLWFALGIEGLAALGATVFRGLLAAVNDAHKVRPMQNTAAVDVSATAPTPRPKPKGAPRGAPKRGKGQKKVPTVGQETGGATILPFKKGISKDDAEKMLREAGTQRAAAEKLGISPRTLRRILTA
jgi:hypothetical protein